MIGFFIGLGCGACLGLVLGCIFGFRQGVLAEQQEPTQADACTVCKSKLRGPPFHKLPSGAAICSHNCFLSVVETYAMMQRIGRQ